MEPASLFRAILEDDIMAVDRALKGGVSIEEKEAFGLAPLFLAVSGGRPRVVAFLLAKGANPNCVTAGGVTPLMLAAMNVERADEPGISIEIARLLIEHGADPNRSNGRGKTALMLAAQNDQRAIAEFLVGRGAKVDARDRCGKTAEDYARLESHGELVDYFARLMSRAVQN